MRWTERQQAQLREMGLRLWGPGDAAPGAAAAQTAEATPAGTAPPPAAGSTAPGAEALTARPPGPAAMPVSAAMQVPAAMPVPAAMQVPPARPAAAALARPADTGGPLPASTRADAAAIAQLDWPALQAAVADCRACGLCQDRRQTVFGTGHRRAHCMVVGEAPGEQEDLAGEPFVGPSGQLLDRMLAALGLTRGVAAHDAEPARQVYIANTLKCRPPLNRNPLAGELATCQPFLERQVALVQPRVILAMGRFAVQSLLGSDQAIGKLRGRLHQWHGVPLVVTYHPAYLLRQPADKARAWDDLCLAASCLDLPMA